MKSKILELLKTGSKEAKTISETLSTDNVKVAAALSALKKEGKVTRSMNPEKTKLIWSIVKATPTKKPAAKPKPAKEAKPAAKPKLKSVAVVVGKIKRAKTPDEINTLMEGDDRKMVAAAATKRLNELNEETEARSKAPKKDAAAKPKKEKATKPKFTLPEKNLINPDGKIKYDQLTKLKRGDVVDCGKDVIGVALYPEWSQYQGRLYFRVYDLKGKKLIWRTEKKLTKVTKKGVVTAAQKKEILADVKNEVKASKALLTLCLAALK